MKNELFLQAQVVMQNLLDTVNPAPNTLFVLGCSTSEVLGSQIGKGGNLEVAQNIYDAMSPLLQERNIHLAVQCCEHLNRALVIEHATATQFGYEIVHARPTAHAGGAMASVAWGKMQKPVLVEHIQAHFGLDIGGTLIGMHLKHVAVPVRLAQNKIGQAHLLCAKTRPKLIGGERTIYV